MEKLPDISDLLLAVMEHYAPIAKRSFPHLNEAAVLDKALEFEGEWLRSQSQQAAELFIARHT